MGHSGVALVRMSGELSNQIIHDLISKQLEHRKATYCTLRDQNEIIDTCIACFFPKTTFLYRRRHCRKFLSWKSVIIEHVIQQCIKRGARPARKGEFTKKLLMNKKLSLLKQNHWML